MAKQRLNTKTSIVDKLKSEGKDSSRSARAKLWKDRGNKTKYKSSYSQNVKLLKGGSVTGSSSRERRNEREGGQSLKKARRDRDDERDSLSESQRDADRRMERILKKKLNRQVTDIEESRTSNLGTARSSHKGEDATLQSGLVRMGGYLGETASGTAAQISLNQDHSDELFEINVEADRALRAAEDAYEQLDMKRMQDNLDRIEELKKFAYKKEQDVIATNMGWTKIRNQADQFAQSQSLKWSTFNLSKDKFDYGKTQDSLKLEGDDYKFNEEVNSAPVKEFSDNWMINNANLTSFLNLDSSDNMGKFNNEISVALSRGYKPESIAQQVIKSHKVSSAYQTAIKNYIKDTSSKIQN